MGWQGGVAASLLGSFSGTLGGQLRICSLTEDVPRKALCLQIFGWTFWLLGQALNQVAILWAPASLTASVNFGGSLLSNALLAPILLRERLTRMHGLSIFLLVLGGLLVTSFSSHATQEYSLLELKGFVHRPAFLVCATFMASFTAFLLIRACCRGFLELLSFAYLFAVVGAIDLLVTKFTLQLLRLLVVAGPQEPHGKLPDKRFVSSCVAFTLLLHISVFGCQVVAVYYRKALQSLPLFLGSGALMQVVVCGTFFDEFGSLDGEQKAFFSCGFVFVMLGLAVTSMVTQSEDGAVETEVTAEAIPSQIFSDSQALRPEAMEAIITSGRLQRNSGSISSADLLLLLAEIQKSALCFGGRLVLGDSGEKGLSSFGRRHASEDLFRPFLARTPSFHESTMCLHRAASAPPKLETPLMAQFGVSRSSSEAETQR